MRSSRCKTCKWLNSHKSLEELQELQLIRDSIATIPDDSGRQFIQVDFPFKIDVPRLFHPTKSNFSQACATTKSLFTKLRKLNLHQEFHNEILSGIEKGHMKLIPAEQTQEILANPHCFSFLNFVCKASSQSTPIRPVCNSSSYHKSGSCNSHLPTGPCLISNLKTIFSYFRLKPYFFLSI